MSPIRRRNSPANFCRDVLVSTFTRPTCIFCKDPNRRFSRKHLCSSCYGMDLKLRKLESAISGYKKNNRPVPFGIDYELKISKQMVELAKMDGQRFGEIHKKDIGGLDVEYAFSRVSKLAAGKDLFHGDSNAFDSAFSARQKQFIFYLLSTIERIANRQNRRKNARYAVEINELDDYEISRRNQAPGRTAGGGDA